MNRLAIRGWNDPGVIVPLPTRGNGNREGWFERASDECLMRRSDTILTASYVNDAVLHERFLSKILYRDSIEIEVVYLSVRA